MKNPLDDLADWFNGPRKSTPPHLAAMGVVGSCFLGLVLLVVICISMSWSYGECLDVGHDETYCQARLIGCVR